MSQVEVKVLMLKGKLILLDGDKEWVDIFEEFLYSLKKKKCM